ncbi:MAG: sulfate ABC transporter permease subunit CysT [Bacilli bacterium]
MIPGFKRTILFTAGYLLLMIIVPLSFVFAVAFADWETFATTITSRQVQSALTVSIGISLFAALTNAVIGTVVAWVLVRYPLPFKRVIDGLIDLPFALPTAVAGISLTALYAPNGWIGQYLPFEVAYTPLGIYVCLVFVSFPYVVRMVQPVIANMDVSYEEVAETLGASKWTMFRRIYLPEMLPALLTGVALSFARAVGEYGSVVFIAGNIPFETEIAPLIIMKKLEQFDYAGASSVAVVMLFISCAILLLINLVERRSSRWLER